MSRTGPSLAILNGEVSGRLRDLVIRGGVIVDADPATADRCFDAKGGAVLPGLRDAHLHLHSMAARAGSLVASTNRADFLSELATAAAAGEWVRVVHYDPDSVGPLDRTDLDRVTGETPVRVQHRSGLAWVFNTAGVGRLREQAPWVRFEVDPGGEITGRVIGQDREVAAALGGELPDPRAALDELLAMGVTSVVDATPFNGPAEALSLSRARQGRPAPEIEVMGPLDLEVPPPLVTGPVKVVIGEDPLPSYTDLVETIAEAHRTGRNVAVHCASHETLVLAAAAWEKAGAVGGDRVEHGSVIRVEMIQRLRSLGLAVVVQPSFVRHYGDHYAGAFPSEEWPNLHRCRSLIAAGVAVKGSSDAPFGDPDPWMAMRTATDRLTGGGLLFGDDERLRPEEALALYTPESNALNTPGAPADLAILDRPWGEARCHLSRGLVVATAVGGQLSTAVSYPLAG